ncbi:MAG: hypothetical protein QNL62_13185 [Gammaproteobacteria bacterium]|nr:hypothetical protein [Gammaproteobacteria bacterium]
MKKIVITLIVLSITIFAAIKGTTWYLTQQFVDNQIVQAKPFVQISYKDIKTSLTGSATVTGIKIYIPAIDDAIYIESIQFLAPDLMTLLALDNKLQRKQLPESLSLLISSASVDLNGNLMGIMDNPNAEPSQLEVFSTLGCGDVYRIGSKALSQMGYDRIINDIVLSYQFNPRNKLLRYTIRNNIRDMTHINLSGELHGVTDLDSFSNNTVKPGKTSLEIVDDSYIERKNRYCANQGKLKIEEYINQHINQLQEYLISYGISPEEGLFNAYKTILETSGSMVFEADLSQLTGTTEFKTFEPNDIIQFVHLRFFVNGKRINEISIAIDKDKLIETATSDEIDVETPDEIKKKRAIIVKKYHSISAAALANFNKFRVRIETSNGKHYKGTINTNDRRIYEVTTRLRSGTISYHIPVDTIYKAEVFY